MNKQIIYCIDEKDSLDKYNTKFNEYFQNFSIKLQDNLSNALLSMTKLVKDGHDIPIVVAGHNIYKDNEHYFLDGVNLGFKKTRFIVLTDDIINKTMNQLDHLHFVPKNWFDSELILTMKEIIKNYFQNIQIEHSAQIDSLTGLYNRRTLSLKLDLCHNPCIILINLDNFRIINKIYGYKFGDKVLQEFSKYILNYFSKEEVFRLISNEFIILKEDLSVEKAIYLAKVFKENLNKNIFHIEDKNINLTLCLAISTQGNNLIEDAQSTIYHGRKIVRTKFLYLILMLLIM